jgi:hypothetical protein
MKIAGLSILSSCHGLTLASILEGCHVSRRHGMDCRVKPGNDDNLLGMRLGGAGA